MLGQPSIYGPGDGNGIPASSADPGEITLLEVPARIAAFGIHTLEICHFHLPSRDRGYLGELRSALGAEGVKLFSLLIDDGDIVHPQYGDRDLTWIAEWIDVAAELGAKCARVIAGKAEPSDAAMDKSLKGMRKLAARAEAGGVRIMTENWFDLLSRPQYVLRLLDDLEGRVGFCFDFGNWKGSTKYDDLIAIAPRAESCHSKAHFTSGWEMDRDDFSRCLEIVSDVGFSGPHTLVYDGPGDDEWEGLALEREVVEPFLQGD